MDVEVDHYVILGLPTGQEGAKLSEKEIKKAYLSKALELHPDKRLDDPNAHENFQKLKTSYEILKDEKARKIFDDLLRVKHEKLMRQSQQNSKRRKMMSDLEERERAAFASDPSMKTHDEEERIARKLKEEIARIRAMHSSKATPVASTFKKGVATGARESTSGGQGGLDKEKVLKVSWDRIGEGYSAQRLRELFQQFGEVEDVVIRSSTKKKGSALVVMASKDAIVTATRCVLGDLQNPLLVLPLQPAVAPTFRRAEEPVRSETPELSNLVGAGFQAFEDSVLSKLRKVHMCIKLASRHVQVGLADPSDVPRCDICENAPAFFYCEIDGSSLCLQCDMIVHVGGKRKHGRYLMLRQRVEFPGDKAGSNDELGLQPIDPSDSRRESN